MVNRRSLLALPLLGLMVAACDDSTAPESQQLSASEAAALAVALDNASSTAVDPEADTEGPDFLLAPSEGAAQSVTTRTDAFDVDVPCPRGGTSNLSGEHVLVIDTDEGFITVDVTASKGHEACVFRTSEGVDITVDGTVSFVAARELREGLAAASQTHSGSLDYVTSDGKEGTCPIDITTEFSLTPGQASRTILGSVCGHEVDVSTSWTHTE
jgi:hypothetical protein